MITQEEHETIIEELKEEHEKTIEELNEYIDDLKDAIKSAWRILNEHR